MNHSVMSDGAAAVRATVVGDHLNCASKESPMRRQIESAILTGLVGLALAVSMAEMSEEVAKWVWARPMGSGSAESSLFFRDPIYRVLQIQSAS